MAIRPINIILDRLSAALARRDVKLKRSDLLGVAAEAFGYRNQNEFTAAFKAGTIAVPPVEVIGRTGTGVDEIIVVRDPIAGACYAIDHSYAEQVIAEEKVEFFSVTPYGHLVDLRPVVDETVPKLSPHHNADEQWVITMEGECDATFLFWSNEDGWVDIENATVFTDRNGRLPLGGIMEGEIKWARLPSSGARQVGNRTGVDETAEPSSRKAHASGVDPSTDMLRHTRPDMNLEGETLQAGSTRWEIIREAEFEGKRYIEFHSEAMATRSVRALRDGIEGAAQRAGVILSVYYDDRLSALVPQDLFEQYQKTNVLAALENLLTPASERSATCSARFIPQAWQRDYAVSVDIDFDPHFDITFEVLLMGKDESLKINDNTYDSDDFLTSVRAPLGMHRWSGPFEIECEGEIEDFWERRAEDEPEEPDADAYDDAADGKGVTPKTTPEGHFWQGLDDAPLEWHGPFDTRLAMWKNAYRTLGLEDPKA